MESLEICESTLIRENELELYRAKSLLKELFRFRRTPVGVDTCQLEICSDCQKHFVTKILKALRSQSKLRLVLPAFPGKSPNSEKVLGPLPDFAEEVSLFFLNELAQKLSRIHQPGVEIVLCSDGRVFSDIVGMSESNVTAYREELFRMIEINSFDYLKTFNLEDYYSGESFSEMRTLLMKSFGGNSDSLRCKIKAGGSRLATGEEREVNRMYCGITRFLFEDGVHSKQKKSRAALQKDAKARAYEVIRRSNAWSSLIEELFTDALRLSIHPQGCGSKKLGIQLVGGDSWMTPWHGVAVETPNGIELMKRREAEAKGAHLCYTVSGRPSHFQLNHNNISTKGQGGHRV